jgi:hypothetical protein
MVMRTDEREQLRRAWALLVDLLTAEAKQADLSDS